jgi:hypothetical protein
VKDLLAFVEHLRADLGEVAAALERHDLEGALLKFDGISLRIKSKVEELRR